MKTRTNQTIALPVVSSMSTLTTAEINRLKAGDIVLKKDESGFHSYIVSYKKEGTGICLTYTDASCVETASYDLVDGEWVYNSTDITPLGEQPAVEIPMDTDNYEYIVFTDEDYVYINERKDLLEYLLQIVGCYLYGYYEGELKVKGLILSADNGDIVANTLIKSSNVITIDTWKIFTK